MTAVVICFWICIFEISNTPLSVPYSRTPCCDLLLNLYLWNIKYTKVNRIKGCGQLWFAFEFVSLKYQIHQYAPLLGATGCCDLLLNLYLWNIKYTFRASTANCESVVICFWICIFEISNTPYIIANTFTSSCDLLLNLYLWNIKYTTIFASCCVISVYKDF